MDEMNMSGQFMKNILSKVLSKIISKKLNAKVTIQFYGDLVIHRSSSNPNELYLSVGNTKITFCEKDVRTLVENFMEES